MTTQNTDSRESMDAGGRPKSTTLDEMLSGLPESRRKAIEEEAAVLIAEEMSLQALRRARQMTQAEVAEALGINQENVSRLERRTDFLMSSLRNYVKAMGGELRLVADFPNRPPVSIAGIADLDSDAVDPGIDLLAGCDTSADFGWNYLADDEANLSIGEGNSGLMAHFLSGQSHLERNEFDKAIGAFSAAIELDPSLLQPYADRAIAYLGIGEGEKAAKDIESIRAMLQRTMESEESEGSVIENCHFSDTRRDYTVGI